MPITEFDLHNPQEAARWLCTPEAIRARCVSLYRLGVARELPHFRIQFERLEDTAQYVVSTIQRNYPSLSIPYHSRWRHFAVGGVDRWAALAEGLHNSPDEQARQRIELAIISVLLDAGAGADWRYQEPQGRVYQRSEGLALASFYAYQQGAFSTTGDALRVDAEALCGFSEGQLAEVFQVTATNPLVGLEGRLLLLQQLGQLMSRQGAVFGETPRLGNLYDHLQSQAVGGQLAAGSLLITLLQTLGDIWPGRIELAGVNLGDVWRHPQLATDDASSELVPFHKLSQWLSYSLVEPLEEAGIVVTSLDDLSGLPEYRNGGLLLDMGLLVPWERGALAQAYPVDHPLVVEWRALTVALLDRVARRVREILRKDAQQLPLASVLEGGTWSAGRRIARSLRPGGPPPIQLLSDGTVF